MSVSLQEAKPSLVDPAGKVSPGLPRGLGGPPQLCHLVWRKTWNGKNNSNNNNNAWCFSSMQLVSLKYSCFWKCFVLKLDSFDPNKWQLSSFLPTELEKRNQRRWSNCWGEILRLVDEPTSAGASAWRLERLHGHDNRDCSEGKGKMDEQNRIKMN